MANDVITKIEGKCQWDECEQSATTIAAGRRGIDRDGHPLGLYCDAHADIVIDEGFPEYHDSCPNCGCRFGVN